MKAHLNSLFAQAISQLKTEQVIPQEHQVHLMFERTKQRQHGDFATNVAMTLVKASGRNPRELAELIIAALPQDDLVAKVEIAGPGFINIFVEQHARFAVIEQILSEREEEVVAPLSADDHASLDAILQKLVRHAAALKD